MMMIAITRPNVCEPARAVGSAVGGAGVNCGTKVVGVGVMVGVGLSVDVGVRVGVGVAVGKKSTVSAATVSTRIKRDST